MENAIKRKKIEEEYQKNKKNFYDENGKVFDLKNLTDTHFVALK